MSKQTVVNIVNPHAAVIVWNYKDRLVGGTPINDLHAVEKMAIPTVSIMSISTNKAKSSPSGEFQITLAPTQNWLTKITSGSWICILMGQTEIGLDELKTRGTPQHIKMVGIIESVRLSVTVNQETGARQTVYIVTGKDWGAVLESMVYLDQLTRDLHEAGPEVAAKMTAVDYLADQLKGRKGLPTSTKNINFIIDFWGMNWEKIFANLPDVTANFKPESALIFPKDVCEYLNLITPHFFKKSRNVADYITVISGVLDQEDTALKLHSLCYKEVVDSVSLLNPMSLMGQHTVWQLLLDQSNDILNEVVADLRFDVLGCRMAIYKRVKPFVVNTPFPGGIVDGGLSKVSDLISPYKNIRSTKLKDTDIISVNAGTNYRDKINFAEIMLEPGILDPQNSANNEIKGANQIPEPQESKLKNAWSREGFRPLLLVSKHLAVDKYSLSNTVSIRGVTDWKYLLKEWYFNTHNMFNGSISFIGQDSYIQVGDNIMFSVDALTPTANMNLVDSLIRETGDFILGHVENVSHEFSVGENGARSFITTVQFVRGIVVDEGKNVPPSMDPGLDQSTDAHGAFDVKAKNVVVTASKISTKPSAVF